MSEPSLLATVRIHGIDEPVGVLDDGSLLFSGPDRDRQRVDRALDLLVAALAPSPPPKRLSWLDRLLPRRA